MDPKELAIRFSRAETEQEVIQILKDAGYWDDYRFWRPYGDNENNYSVIGNQQSNADAALVEKLVNSVDAVLMKGCEMHGIAPDGPDAPRSKEECLRRFFDMPEGRINNWSIRHRNQMARQILLAATGDLRGEENFTLVDQGEGQTPKRMPETILSISRSNKLKVPFVQGKFNMGGTGALSFCGEHHFQLVISRRCPEIPNWDNDPTYSLWSVTMVRKESAREGRKSSMYTYLVDEKGEMLTFAARSLPVIPTAPQGKAYESMEYGTLLKLYNYTIPGYKSALFLTLNYRLSLLMPDLCYPICLRECRKLDNTRYEGILNGLVTRLSEDKNKNLEEGYPTSGLITVESQEIPFSIYLFKSRKYRKQPSHGKRNQNLLKNPPSSSYKKNDGIVFTVKGQAQGIISNQVFDQLQLSFIRRELLVLVDCSRMSVDYQEKLFMTSRDRLRSGIFPMQVRNALNKVLKENEGLRKANFAQKMARIKNKTQDNKQLTKTVEQLVTRDPLLTKLFKEGTHIHAPQVPNTQLQAGRFEGKEHPTYFWLLGKNKDGRLEKQIPANHQIRVQFETDARNNYFSRKQNPGNLQVLLNGKMQNELRKSLSLYNGKGTLQLLMPQSAQVGDLLIFTLMLQDPEASRDFQEGFTVQVLEPQAEKEKKESTKTEPRSKHKRKSAPNKGSRGRKKNGGLNLPSVHVVHKDEWNQYDMDEHSALFYAASEEGDDYFLNGDNAFLLQELRRVKDNGELEIKKVQYKTSMVLVGMSVVNFCKQTALKRLQKAREDGTEPQLPDIPDQVDKISAMMAPLLLPMLENVADLQMEAGKPGK